MPPKKKWNYFSDEEVEGLQNEFIAKLDMARQIAGVPFIITSGFRSSEKNQSVIGAVPNSAHLKGLAVDLQVIDDRSLFKIIKGSMESGINRFGIYFRSGATQYVPVHVHMDIDDTKPPEVIWLKQEGA